jgi:hypothetical protein
VQTQAVPASGEGHEEPGNTPQQNETFDADATRLMGVAFDAAWEAVLTSCSPLTDAPAAASMRELLAKDIIDTVRLGERNRDRLVESALRALAHSQIASIKLSAG